MNFVKFEAANVSDTNGNEPDNYTYLFQSLVILKSDCSYKNKKWLSSL